LMEMTRCGVVLTTSLGDPSASGVAVGELMGEATDSGVTWGCVGEVAGGLGAK
jgi:hypothetical protein